MRTFAEPALDVNGIESGSPHIQKTVLPVQADANVSIRLAPGQQVEPVVDAFGRLLREAAPAGAELDVELLAAAPPAIMSANAKPIQLGLNAFERGLGVRPLLIRSGGSAADRGRVRGQGNRDRDHRLLAPERQPALAQRAPAGGVRPARDRDGAGAVRRVRGFVRAACGGVRGSVQPRPDGGHGPMDVERSETQNQADECARAAVTISSTHVGSATAVESSTRW